MSTPELAEALRRSARLRAQVERTERDSRPVGWVRRRYSLVVDMVVLLTLVVLCIDGLIAYSVFR